MGIGIDPSLNADVSHQAIMPAWKVFKSKRKADQLEWFQNTLRTLEEYSETRIERHVNNLLWYSGEIDYTREYQIHTPDRERTKVPTSVVPQMFSHLFDITEQRVSRLSRFKPDFDLIPTNLKEGRDYTRMRLLRLALEHLQRKANFDLLFQSTERWNAVFGECLISTQWDEHAGPREKGKSVGDIVVSIKEPWTWLPEPQRKREDVNWGIDIWKIMHIEEARVLFKKPSLQPDKKRYIFEFNDGLDEKREDEVVVYRVISRPSKYDEDGFIIYICSDEIVKEERPYPYNHKDFDFEWHTDIDVPGRLFPLSFYNYVKPLQHVYNKLTGMICRNIFLVAHPHVMMPKGAAKREAFGNGPTFIEYNGQAEPKLVTFNSVPQDVFSFREGVKQEMGQVSGIQGVSRGTPPSGVRAASMLRFFEEQEEQRASTSILKHNELIRRVYLKSASIMGQYYPGSSKERLLQVIGRDREYEVIDFAKADFSDEFDVVILNSTGFSKTMSGRLEEIGMIQQFAPDLLSKEQMADVLELKAPQKIYDISTSAIKHAEQENERFLAGLDVPPPQPHQDLILHWRTHQILFNSLSWELNVPEKNKEKAYLHQAATEELMFDLAAQNQTFQAELMALRGFPAFMPPPLPDPNPPPQAAPIEQSPTASVEGSPTPPQEPMEGESLPPPNLNEVPSALV